MPEHAFAIADVERVAVFSALSGTRNLFRSATEFNDEQGISWRYVPIAGSVVGISTLGPGWVWNEVARQRSQNKYEDRLQKVRSATAEQVETQFVDALAGVRLGTLAERMLWVIQVLILSSRSSRLTVLDQWLAAQLWGSHERPRGWRRAIVSIFDGLSWLHVSDAPNEGVNPHFGDETALLTRIRDLRGTAKDQCPESCPMTGKPHSHFRIDVGPGFLGIMEACGDADDQGIRTYRFPSRSRRKKGDRSLRKLGKTGRLMSVFLPAKLGRPEKCRSLSGRQHRLLQALVRELTRKPARDRDAGFDTFVGNRIPRFVGSGLVTCPALDSNATYVAFNGNGTRRGLGYRLNSAGGWLARAGYDPQRECRQFLRDLKRLAKRLGLTAVAIKRGDRFYSLTELQALVDAGRWNQVDAVHLRVYAGADFVEKWSRYFLGKVEPIVQERRPGDVLLAVQQAITQKGLSNGEVADELQIDRSFFSKVMRQWKPAPAGLLEKMETWLNQRPLTRSAAEKRQSAGAVSPTWDLLSEANDYLERGWAILPQVPISKKPHVKWKPFQERLPTFEEWLGWSRQWPNAGLILVLGPVSDVCVIDVDGEEAHDALLNHLGTEPLAPKVISGSGAPHKFHLYFKHPDVATRASMTPWHPKLEFRGHGGILVLPPSIHPSGKRYKWAKGRSLEDLPLPSLPKTVVAAITAKSMQHEYKQRANKSDQRTTATSAVAGMQVSPSTARFLSGAEAHRSNWNKKLFRAACDLRGRKVPLSRAMPLLLKGAKPHTDSNQQQAQQTIESAYSKPREPGRK